MLDHFRHTEMGRQLLQDAVSDRSDRERHEESDLPFDNPDSGDMNVIESNRSSIFNIELGTLPGAFYDPGSSFGEEGPVNMKGGAETPSDSGKRVVTGPLLPPAGKSASPRQKREFGSKELLKRSIAKNVSSGGAVLPNSPNNNNNNGGGAVGLVYSSNPGSPSDSNSVTPVFSLLNSFHASYNIFNQNTNYFVQNKILEDCLPFLTQ